jgi:trk system potassium uptake protein TrkA
MRSRGGVKYLVIGLGAFGSHVARVLGESGEDVMAVDSDAAAVARMRDVVSRAVQADVSDPDVLARLCVEGVDVAVVSIGEHLEASILATLALKEQGVREVYAKAKNPMHGKILEAVGATETIYPERDMAIRLAQRLAAPNLLEHVPVAEGYSIQEVASPEFVGKTLRQLDLRNRYRIQVMAVKELVPERFHLVPDPDFVIKDSDALIVMGKNEDLENLR